MEREHAKASEWAFEVGWHRSCPDVEIVSRVGGGAIVFCPKCRCVADLEAVGRRITYSSSAQEG